MRFYARYNAQEGKLTVELPEAFDGYLINGPNLEYYKTAFSHLISKTKKPFIVDPHTFDLRDSRESHRKYLEKLGIEKELNAPATTTQTKHDAVEKIIRYQENRVNEVLSEDPLEEANGTFYPEVLIAPYWTVTDSTDPALKTNLDLLNIAKEIRPEKSVYATILLPKDALLDDKDIAKICEKYANSGADGYCISILNFDEYSESAEYLEGFRRFVDLLSRKKKPIISLYAGFFDLLLNNKGLDVMVHGFDSGDKLVISAKSFGGRKQSRRRYICALKKRFTGAELDFIGKKAPELLRCGCRFCKGEEAENRVQSIKHYILARRREIEDANRGVDLLAQIKQAHQKYSELFKYSLKLNYLQRWYEAASKKI